MFREGPRPEKSISYNSPETTPIEVVRSTTVVDSNTPDKVRELLANPKLVVAITVVRGGRWDDYSDESFQRWGNEGQYVTLNPITHFTDEITSSGTRYIVSEDGSVEIKHFFNTRRYSQEKFYGMRDMYQDIYKETYRTNAPEDSSAFYGVGAYVGMEPSGEANEDGRILQPVLYFYEVRNSVLAEISSRIGKPFIKSPFGISDMTTKIPQTERLSSLNLEFEDKTQGK